MLRMSGRRSGAVGDVGACWERLRSKACRTRASMRQTGWLSTAASPAEPLPAQNAERLPGLEPGNSVGAARSAARVQHAALASLPRCPGRSPKGTSWKRCGRAPQPLADNLRPPPTRAADRPAPTARVLYLANGVTVRLAAGCLRMVRSGGRCRSYPCCCNAPTSPPPSATCPSHASTARRRSAGPYHGCGR